MNQPTTSRIIIPGPPGDPRVAKALFGQHIKTGTMVLEGYVLAKQLVIPDAVLIKGGLQQAWIGHTFPGAFTFVPQEGGSAKANYIEVSPNSDERASVENRLSYWNYHDEGWYQRQFITTPDEIPTEAELLTDIDAGNLEIVTGDHPFTEEAVLEMVRQAQTEFGIEGGEAHEEPLIELVEPLVPFRFHSGAEVDRS